MRLQLTYQALAALQATSEHDGFGMAETAKPVSSDLWEIEVEQDVLEAIARQAFPGETASDTIIRLAHFYCGGRSN